MSLAGKEHPFYAFSVEGRDFYLCGGEDRRTRLKQLDAEGLRAVLALPDLQRTVRQAAAARLRRLERAARTAAGS
ncbi:MAG: hypothetical protein ACOY42_02130 [Pseudomonadota bacterium]